ncbi:MAG TPA: hypothetical protein VFL61_13495 [Gaiellaceae bacterium]|nr:hypothetical protein [Gaiellaceae bacterium]
MWWRLLIAFFLVLHGIVFSFLDPESWLFDDGRGLYFALGIVAAVALTIGAILLVARRRAWRPVLATGAAVSLVQLLVFFEPGQFVGVGVDIAILAVIAWTYRSTAERSKVARVSPA